MSFDTPTRFPCGNYKPGFEPRVTTGGTQNTNPPVFHPQSNSDQQVFPVEPPDDPPPPDDLIPPRNPRPGDGIGKVTSEPQFRPKWRCSERILTCTEDADLQLPDRRILGIFRECVECMEAESEECVYDSSGDCIQLCRSTQDSENPCISISRPRYTSISLDERSNANVNQNTIIISENNLSQKQKLQVAVANTPGRGLINAGTESFRLQSITPTKNTSIIKLNTQQNKGYSTNTEYRRINGGLYDPYYNFTKTKISQATKLYRNNRYLNIFKNEISSEVSYFLDRENSKLPWNEKEIHNLTNEKIALSIKDDLRTSLNNIHTVGNQRIVETQFYNTIKKHLMEGTLSEFDPYHYISLYNNQLQDQFVEYDKPGNNKTAIDAAFAAFETKSIKSDYTNAPTVELINDFKRIRFLLEDLEANVPALQLNGNSNPIYLNNAGMLTSSLGSSSILNMGIGDGAGYYFSALTYDGTPYPLSSQNSLSEAYYLDINNRANVMRILGEQLQLKLTANSLPGVNEFSSSYNPSADIEPMYFAIDLGSVGEIVSGTTLLGTINSVVNITSATFRRITNEEATAHSRNYSFNLVKINIDYRDPFIHYAKDASAIQVEQKDFNLRNLGYTRTTYSNRIMLRNIPHGIILTPGCGSFHNPMNGKSNLVNYTGDVVSRTIQVSPSLNISDKTKLTPFIESSRIYEEFGNGYLGLYEKYFAEDVNGFIYTYNPSSSLFDNSYYYGGGYSKTQPPSSTRSNSAESNFLSLVNKLTSISGVTELTWWDVFRRMSAKEIGSLMYSRSSRDLIDRLSNGYSNNVQIKSVIARPTVVPTGIPDDAIIPDDVIYINEEDR